MPSFNRERAKSELGWDDAQIDAYLASPQGRIDSTAVAPPQASPEPVDGNLLGDVSGMAASALDAIGGPRTLLYGGAGVGALAGAKKVMGRLSAPPAAAPEAPAKPRAGSPRRGAAKHPPSLVAVTKEDIKNFPQLKNYKAGQTIRRARMEDIKLRTLASQPGTAQSRVPVRPISIVEGGEVSPASAPAQTKDPPYTGGRGASGPELERRGAAMARVRQPSVPEPDIESRLARSLEAEGAMSRMGVPKGQMRVPLRAGLRAAGGGALSLLPYLLGIQSLDEDMEEARRIYTEAAHQDPSVLRALIEGRGGL